MPKFTLEEAAQIIVLPVDTIVQVTCTEINERTVPGKDGKEGWVKLEFKFVIDGIPSNLDAPDAVGSHIWGSVAARFTTHIDNKLRQWATALLGLELDEGFELDTDMLLNRKARALIGQYQKKDGSFAHQVVGLLPVVQGSAPASATVRTGDLAKDTLASYKAQPVLAVGFEDDDPPPF